MHLLDETSLWWQHCHTLHIYHKGKPALPISETAPLHEEPGKKNSETDIQL